MADTALKLIKTKAAVEPNHKVCRICRKSLPGPFIDFGRMPLANSFLADLDAAAREAAYPLAVSSCESCGFVQLNHVVPAEELYSNYIYVSSTSETVRQHARWLSQKLGEQYSWKPEDLIVEVASNDGTVLKAFQSAGFKVLGIEPAANIAATANADGVPTAAKFFTAATAREIAAQYGSASAILGRHVFAHVNDVHDFIEGAGILLNEKGVLLIEVPYFGDLLRCLEFDTIYHEHLSYITLEPIVRLCREHGMELVDIDRLSIHGGSVILHIRRKSSGARVSANLSRMLDEERQLRLTAPDTLKQFARSVEAWRREFTGLIEGLSGSGARLIGYGAAAKSTTLLNYCPSVASKLSCVLDRSPHKQGLFTPGTHLPVKPVEHWKEAQATHMVILAWNFGDEIMRQMRPFAEQGGRFVIPIPKPRII